MSIFPKIHTDEVVQVNDKFRIDATKSYVSKGEDAITLVEIEAESGSGFIDVTGSAPLNAKNWYLDWEYAADGAKIISVRITTDGLPTTITKTISALLEDDDYLFSSDDDLSSLESDILNYLPQGKNSFKYMHREAQKEILEWLYTNGYTKSDNVAFTKVDFVDVEQVRFWSKYMTLRLVFEDISKQENDAFSRKAKEYESDEHKWRQKSILKIDVNSDGIQDNVEGFNLTTKSFVRE
jgi:hypothetical protein